MAQSKIPKERLGPLNIGSADIGTAGISPSNIALSGATSGQALLSNGTVWVPASLPTSVTFVDAEIPSGTKNGINTAFGLGGTPSPVSSLQLFVTGQLQLQGTASDYLLSSGTVITMTIAPGVNDTMVAYYRK